MFDDEYAAIGIQSTYAPSAVPQAVTPPSRKSDESESE